MKRLRKVGKRGKVIKKNDDELRAKLKAQSDGRCNRCHELPDWRGLSLSHTKPKGMGGTLRKYTEDEAELLCYPCHSQAHGIREVRA